MTTYSNVDLHGSLKTLTWKKEYERIRTITDQFKTIKTKKDFILWLTYNGLLSAKHFSSSIKYMKVDQKKKESLENGNYKYVICPSSKCVNILWPKVKKCINNSVFICNLQKPKHNECPLFNCQKTEKDPLCKKGIHILFNCNHSTELHCVENMYKEGMKTDVGPHGGAAGQGFYCTSNVSIKGSQKDKGAILKTTSYGPVTTFIMLFPTLTKVLKKEELFKSDYWGDEHLMKIIPEGLKENNTTNEAGAEYVMHDPEQIALLGMLMKFQEVILLFGCHR